METATGFDLEVAIRQWRTQLASQLPEGTDAVAELESHLRHAIGELGLKGLTPEESFLIASRRLGSTKALGDEFRKANPAAVWRQRVFWMVAGCLAIRLWSSFSYKIVWVLGSRANLEPGVIPWAYAVAYVVLSLIPFAVFWQLARSSPFQVPQRLRSLWGARLRFFGWLAFTAVGLFALGESVPVVFGSSSPFQDLSMLIRTGIVGTLLPTLLLAGFLAWLMPRHSDDPLRS